MPDKIDTYKYHFKVGGRIVRYGITRDLEQREETLRQREGWEKGRIKQVGNKTTLDGAKIWEIQRTFMGKSTDYLEVMHPSFGRRAKRNA